MDMDTWNGISAAKKNPKAQVSPPEASGGAGFIGPTDKQ